MGKKTTIKIKKRIQVEWLLWLLIVAPFLLSFLNANLGVPHGIRYILDIAWLWLLILIGMKRRRDKKREIGILALWVILFLVYTVLVYMVEYQSGFYYLWGLRNNFRCFIAFFAFSSFLTPEDVADYVKLFDFIFWINFILSLYQYLFMELRGDHLGGVFSTSAGGNGYTNIFFSIVVAKDILLYLEKREKLRRCALKCVAALLIAALAELKFFFVEFVVILGLASMFTKFTWRKFGVILGGLTAVILFAALLSELFPIFEDFLSFDYFISTGSSDKGYTSSGDLNRLNAIPQINELWLKNGWQRAFGLGLGNCDTASFEIVNTPFFRQYGDMHYTWISYAMMYLETGWIGLVFYWGFFVLVYFQIQKIEKRSEGITQTYCRIARIMAILCVAISIYNSSLRTEAGYMAYFVLAVPFVLNRARNKYSGEK